MRLAVDIPAGRLSHLAAGSASDHDLECCDDRQDCTMRSNGSLWPGLATGGGESRERYESAADREYQLAENVALTRLSQIKLWVAVLPDAYSRQRIGWARGPTREDDHRRHTRGDPASVARVGAELPTPTEPFSTLPTATPISWHGAARGQNVTQRTCPPIVHRELHPGIPGWNSPEDANAGPRVLYLGITRGRPPPFHNSRASG